MQITLALIATSLIAVFGQEVPCCVPATWSGVRGGLGAQVFSLQPELDGVGEVTFYDYANNRLRLDIDVQSLSGRNERKATEIYRWDQGRVFIIENGQCRTEALNGSMVAFCVPPNAQKRGSLALGATLNTDAWSFTERSTSFELIVSSALCVPVVQAAANVETITERAVADLWVNVSTAFYPASVFDPPAICSQEVSGSRTFDYFEYIKKDLSLRKL